MKSAPPDHYATLGLDRACTTAQVRAAYRALAKQHHPDLHPSPEATHRIQALNAAHAALSDPARRRAYDRELQNAARSSPAARVGRLERNIAHDVHLQIEELLRGASLEIRVKDPAHSEIEFYPLEIPAGTVPGARFRVPRAAPLEGGFVQVRVRVAPNFRFKAKGSDLRCDLRISTRRAAEGGSENISGPTGTSLRVKIPPGVERGEVLRVTGEGLPKLRGDRGDLLVRVTYRPEVRVSRTPRR